MPSSRATEITGVHTVGVPVSDQDRALEFYLDTLGFEKRQDTLLEQLGDRWIEVAPTGAEITIALVSARGSGPVGVQTGIRFTTPDAAAAHANLHDRGVDVGELLRWPGVPPMFAARDQDGNGFEIVEQR